MPRCASSLSAPWGGTDRAHRPSPRDCGYAWAERDALFLEGDARAALAARHDPDNASSATRDREMSRRNRADAEALAARLVLSEEDLAAADAEARKWLKDWEKNEKKK
jgi:hypothetical protein